MENRRSKIESAYRRPKLENRRLEIENHQSTIENQQSKIPRWPDPDGREMRFEIPP